MIMEHSAEYSEENDQSASQTTSKWKKGVPDPTNDRINHWSLNGFGEPVFTGGLYSKEEIRTLETAVKDYCASRSVTPLELCGENHNKAVRGAWHEIAQCLPHRTVLSVYRRALRQFCDLTTGKWSQEEIDSLSRLVELHGQKWKTIQNKLGRSANNCRAKFYEMNDEFEKGKWSEQKLELLLHEVRDVLGIPEEDSHMDVREINEWTLDTNSKIPWTIISFRVLRGQADCYFKWRSMTRKSNKIAANMGLETVPMARSTLKFDTKLEYYQWKAEQNPKWREKYASECILLLNGSDFDGLNSQIQHDDSLLNAVIQSRANRHSEMTWQTIRDTPDGMSSRERFEYLVDEYAHEEAMDLPLWELAKVVRSSYNKFVNAGNDSTENTSTQHTGRVSARRAKPKETPSNSIAKSAPHISGINIGTIRDNINEIISTVDCDNITVKGVRKILEKKLGLRLSKYKDEIRGLVMDAL